MKANTRLFGEIDIADDKIISLEDGMIGLPEYRNFALIFDEEKEKDKSSVMMVPVHRRSTDSISGHAAKPCVPGLQPDGER